MSPRKIVYSLSYLSLKKVSIMLSNVLSESEICDSIKKFLLEATHEALQDLLSDVLSFEYLAASTRFACLKAIFRKDIKRLDTGLFPHSYYTKILNVIQEEGEGLQHLGLKGVWLRDHTELLAASIKKLNNLKVLIIPHSPDDLVLQAAVDCKQLTVLDISGECPFTNKGLELIRSDNVKVLSIGMFGKRNFGDKSDIDGVDIVANLIKNLPNLSVLKTYSFTGEALLKIYKENCNFKTRLKYIHDTNTSEDILNAVGVLCPQLESVNFNSPLENVLNNAGCLKHLNSLKISAVNKKEVLFYLKDTNFNISTLKFGSLRGGSLDVSRLAVLVPELVTLECYKCKLITLQPENYFINLQTLEMLYCEISDDVLKYLLQNAPYLRRVVVGDVIRMTDGDIFRLCAETDFHFLEELWFSCAKGLTATSVELLMGHCSNLKILGQLNGWDIHRNEMEFLRGVILSTNTDLTLLPLEETSWQ